MLRTCVIAALFGSPLVVACSSNQSSDLDPFTTFQACWDEHHTVEMFSVQRAIEICCIDHPIGDPPVNANLVCGATAASCATYVTANLSSSSATTDEISAACADYVVERAG